MKYPIPEGRWVELDRGYRLHISEAGQLVAGRPTVLCLHGGGPGASGYSNYKLNMSAIAAAGYYVIAPDLLGFGLSDKPEDVDYTSQLHVELLLETMAQLGIDQFIPVGNSLGGSVALELYFARPAEVPALVLMAPGGVVDPATFWGSTDGGKALAAFAAKTEVDEAEFRSVMQLLVHNQSVVDQTLVNERLAIARSQPKRVFTSVSIQPTWERLGDITCPVLCFWGANDRFLPASQAQVLQDQVARIKTVIDSRAGHWYMLECPQDFNQQTLWFLQQELT